MHIRPPLLVAAIALTACTTPAGEPAAPAATADFLDRIQAYCGHAYAGKVVSDDPQDESWARETIVADFVVCTDDEVRIPLHVGDDRSRTWILTRGGDDRLTLRHQHKHEDGSADALSMYGGVAPANATSTRQTFPADQPTKDLFDAEDIPVSKANVWAMEIHPASEMFAYELARPERFFRIEFDLSEPVEAPGEPW